MSDGRHEARKEEVRRSRSDRRAIVGREALATFPMTAGGPNSYRFTYRPSDVEPFDLSAAALDPRADVLEVEVGSASAKLRQVR